MAVKYGGGFLLEMEGNDPPAVGDWGEIENSGPVGKGAYILRRIPLFGFLLSWPIAAVRIYLSRISAIFDIASDKRGTGRSTHRTEYPPR